jgi:DEAD/DEAH box helicase domain-containing protein
MGTEAVAGLIGELLEHPDFKRRIFHVEHIDAREAQYSAPEIPLDDRLLHALARMDIETLYSHQAEAVDAVRRGENVAVVTSTASGKTLCYNLPVLEALLKDPDATALYLYPTKALAQDQLKALERLASSHPDLGDRMRMGTYDGDTPPNARRKLRDEGNLILSNPDMLHAGILPRHTKWSRFFSNLRFVVVDEIHSYRGIFGSNVAGVLRRLRRIVRRHGSNPVFILSSATIANPQEHAERLIGLPVTLVDRDGSPRGRKTFVLWNPPTLDEAKMVRRSSNVEAHELFVALVERGIQTIAFAKARVVAELVLRYAREALLRNRPELAGKIRAYRGGYLPGERRKIEKALFSGDLMGVSSTNALELGIDVGSLDASIIVGFPGTIASTWQQAGRAGRASDDALAVLIAYNDPIDQYLVRHPEYFFDQSPESAVIDPENPYILSNHLGCAAFELPLTGEDATYFGALAPLMAEALEAAEKVKEIDGHWYWASAEFPAMGTNLRTISDNTFTILDANDRATVIGNVDAISAPELVYPEAIYLHDGETYFVRELDLEQKIAVVEKRQVDYYTQPMLESSIRIREPRKERPTGFGHASVGDAVVTWATVAFKKIQFYGMDSIGYATLDLPPQHLETVACWFWLADEVSAEVRSRGKNPVEGLVGIRNLLISLLPLFAMCDRQDVGGVVDSSQTGKPTVFLYDRFHGGLGFAARAYEDLEELLRVARDFLNECGCESGCPSCVGLPVLIPPQHQDPDVISGWPIPDKETAGIILERIAGGQT